MYVYCEYNKHLNDAMAHNSATAKTVVGHCGQTSAGVHETFDDTTRRSVNIPCKRGGTIK